MLQRQADSDPGYRRGTNLATGPVFTDCGHVFQNPHLRAAMQDEEGAQESSSSARTSRRRSAFAGVSPLARPPQTHRLQVSERSCQNQSLYGQPKQALPAFGVGLPEGAINGEPRCAGRDRARTLSVYLTQTWSASSQT